MGQERKEYKAREEETRARRGRENNGDYSSRAESAAQSWSKKMSVLEMWNVSRVYGLGAAEVHALENIDLAVGAGTMVAVMGPSGSGKSTLLTIAGSLEDPTSGEVLVGGAALSRMSRNDKARLR